MSIHLYTSFWNEERIIPFFLRHYEPLVDRIVVYDDNSTDRSVELLRASPKTEVRQLERSTKSFLDAHISLFETCWQESRGQADWVCLADLDEFLYHPDWHPYLEAQKKAGVTILHTNGYDMVSESFPPADASLATTLTQGQREYHLDKAGVFNPAAIEQINHVVGRHLCSPVGRVVLPKQRQIQLRHYKNLGLDYVLARTHALASRLTNDDHARGWSSHYLRDDDALRAGFEEKLSQAEPVPSPPRMKPSKKIEKKVKKKPWWRF